MVGVVLMCQVSHRQVCSHCDLLFIHRYSTVLQQRQPRVTHYTPQTHNTTYVHPCWIMCRKADFNPTPHSIHTNTLHSLCQKNIYSAATLLVTKTHLFHWAFWNAFWERTLRKGIGQKWLTAMDEVVTPCVSTCSRLLVLALLLLSQPMW